MRERSHRHHPHPLAAVALLICGLCLTGCTLMDRAGELLYPTVTPSQGLPTVEQPPTSELDAPAPATQAPTPQALATESSSAAATEAPPVTGVPLSEPPPTPAVAPTPQDGQSMLYAQGGGIYLGDRLGGDAQEVALMPQLDSWDLQRGSLAAAHGRAVDMVDLAQGRLTSLIVEQEGAIAYAQVLWSASGAALMYAGIVEDPSAETFQRSLILKAYAGDDGNQLGEARISDVTGVILLRYDPDESQVTLIPQKGSAALEHVDVYDLRSGEALTSLPIAGEGQASISPDGRLLLTTGFDDSTGRHQLWFYPLRDATSAPAIWMHPENTQSDSHIWSPDGRQVAMLMRDGVTTEEASKGLGLWVLDLASLEAREILEDESLSSSLLAWTPDGELILGHHRAEDGGYYYVLRPDGGGRQILPLSEEVEILGWMQPPRGPAPPKVVVDPWRARFVATEGDPEAIAQIVAEIAVSEAEVTSESLTGQIQSYLAGAGWGDSQGEIRVIRLADDVSVAQLLGRTVYLLDSGQASPIARSDMLIDARLVGNELGLIFGNRGASSLQPAYMLFKRPEESAGEQAWRVVWAPMGHRDWIATDGEIRFVGEGLDTLEVRGSSFGLDLGDSQVFAECKDCPHRRLMGIWERQGDVYTRQTELSLDRPLAEHLWEMTDVTPYALLDEFLRRARDGQDVADLAEQAVLGQADALGLLDQGALLRAEEETPEGVRFARIEGEDAFIAEVGERRVTRVEMLTR